MDINDLTLGQINELKVVFGSGGKTGTSGKHVLTSTFPAGVHVGYLTSKEGTNIVLSKAGRIWRWGGSDGKARHPKYLDLGRINY